MRVYFLAFLLSLTSYVHASSYDDDLKKLFELTGVVNSYINMNTQVINQMQTGYLRAADESIDSSKFSVEQKKQAGEILKSRFATMVKNYEAHVKKSMSFDKVMNDVYLPLYKETYSANDVKELLIFYQSPLGKKTLAFSKNANGKISERTAEKYDNLVFEFVKKQIDENIAIVKREISAQVK